MSFLDDQRKRDSPSFQLALAIESLARMARCRNGEFSIRLHSGQVVKVAITRSMSFELNGSKSKPAIDDDTGIIHIETVCMPAQFEMDAMGSQMYGTIMSHLTRCLLKYGTIYFELRDGAVFRITLAPSFLITEYEGMDAFCFVSRAARIE